MILCAELQIFFLPHTGAKQEFLKNGVVWSAVYRRQDVTLDYWKLPISPISFPDPLEESLLFAPEDDQNKDYESNDGVDGDHDGHPVGFLFLLQQEKLVVASNFVLSKAAVGTQV